MKNGWKYVITGTALLLALVVVVLQLRSAWEERQENQRRLDVLRQGWETMEEQEKTMHRDLARWYNLNLHLDTPSPGFQEAYESILNFGEGMMGTLTIPGLALSIPMTHGTVGEAGHDPASALPIGGRGNHTVIHMGNWMGSALPEPGTVVVIECLGTSLIYRVESVQVMPAEWSPDREEENRDLLTLVLDGRVGLSRARTLIRCGRSNTLDIQPEIPKASGLRAALAAVFTCLLPLTACVPGVALRRAERRHKYRKHRGKVGQIPGKF